MKGIIRSVITSLLAIILFIPTSAINVFAEEEPLKVENNLALNATVEYSGVEGGKVGDEWKYPEFVGEKVVDGNKESRWSADTVDYQWITLDLKDEYIITNINLYFHATSPKYDVSVSLDGTNYTTVFTTESDEHGKTKVVPIDVENIKARYIKYEQHVQWKHTNGKFYGSSLNEIEVSGYQENILPSTNLALNKTVEYSGVEGGKEGEEWKYPQFVGEMVVDGDIGTRWSADKVDEQWLMVDLGKAYTIDKIVLNFHAESPVYSILTSLDGVAFNEVKRIEDGSQGNEIVKELSIDPTEARYVKYNQHKQWNHTNGKKYGSSLIELEIYPYFKQEETDDGSIKVGTFNIAAGSKPNIDTLRTHINNQKLDVVGLQEVDKFTGRNNIDMLEEIATGLFKDSYFSKAIDFSGGEYGIGLLSKSDILERDHTFVTTLPNTENRVFQRIVIEKGNRQIAVYNTHLSYETTEIRNTQFKELINAVNNDPIEYKIIMGDFNADQYNSEFYPFLDKYDMVNGYKGEWLDSYVGIDYDMYTDAVDNIIHTRNLKLNNHSMIKSTHISDHNMIVAEFEFLDESLVSNQYLGLLIEDAKNVDINNLKEISKPTLENAIKEAESVFNASVIQSEIDAASLKLQTVLNELELFNLALKANVKYSGVEGGKKPNGEWLHTKFEGLNITDGTFENRWSADKKDNQWAIVDLGSVKEISDIILYFHATSPEYDVLVSEDGLTYTKVYSVVNGSHGEEERVNIELENPMNVKYVKYQQNKQFTHSGNNQKYGSSLTEIEVYNDLKIESILLNKEKEVLAVNDTMTLEAKLYPEVASFKGIKWSSSDESIATVGNGKIETHKEGQAIITVSSLKDDSIKTEFTLDVVDGDIKVKEIKLEDEINLYDTQKRFMDYTVYPEKAINRDAEVVWELEDTNLGELDPTTGHFVPLKVGSSDVKVYLKEDPTIFDVAKIIVAKEDVDDAYPMMSNRWLERVVGGDNDMSNPEVKAYIDNISGETELLLSQMNREDNRVDIWDRIPSDTVSANYTTQFTKIETLARGFGVKGSAYYLDKDLLNDIVESLEFMVINKKYNGTYSTGNWWDWQIGSTHKLTDTLMVIAPYLTVEQVDFFVKPLEGYAKKPSLQWPSYTASGANRTDIGITVLGSAIIARRDDRMDLVANEVPQVFRIVTSGDGIYKDGSLIQHNNIAYTGSYGNELVKGIGRIQSITAETKWSFEEEGLQSVFHLVDKGYIPLMMNGKMMNMVNGRSISRAPQTNPFTTEFEAGSETISNVMSIAKFAPEEYQEKFYAAIKQWLNTSEPYYNFMAKSRDMGSLVEAQSILEDDSIEPLERVDEAIVYGSMARAVQNSKDYTYGISMYNRKVANYEFGNTENARGWYTGSGALYFYNNDLDQFEEGYWPTIDSYHIPGTTVDARPVNNGAGSGKLNGDSWVGGTSNGKYASVGMKYDATSLGISGINTKANKSWFMMDGYVVALGSDINGTSTTSIDTTVENRMLESNGNTILVNGQDAVNYNKKDVNLNQNEFIHLDSDNEINRISYVFPKGAKVSVEKETRTGKYEDINQYFVNDKVYTKDYFKLIQSHGQNVANESYSYILVPGLSIDETKSFIASDKVEILAQDTEKHAIYDKGSQAFMMNVWSDSGIEFNNIKVDKAAAITVIKVKDKIIITLAEPRQNNATINLEYTGDNKGVISTSDKVVDNGDGTFTINTSQSAGETHTIVLQGDVDKTELINTLNDAKDIDETLYTPKTYEELELLFDEAQTLIDDSNATQNNIDEVVEKLINAINNLELLANLDDIKELVESTKAINLNKYEQEVEDNLKALIDKIEVAISNKNITQIEVDTLYDELETFLSTMVEMTLDYSLLSSKIKQVELLDLTLYKEEGVKKLKEVLAHAKEIEKILMQRVVIDRRITQEDIDNAIEALDNHVKALELKDIPEVPDDLDITKLLQLLEYINKLNLNEYTPETVQNLEKVLAQIEIELQDINLTQEEIDDIVIRLQAAVDGLEKVKDPTKPIDEPKVPTGIANAQILFVSLIVASVLLLAVMNKKKRIFEK